MFARNAHQRDENSLAATRSKSLDGMLLLLIKASLFFFFFFFFLPPSFAVSQILRILCDLSAETWLERWESVLSTIYKLPHTDQRASSNIISHIRNRTTSASMHAAELRDEQKLPAAAKVPAFGGYMPCRGEAGFMGFCRTAVLHVMCIQTFLK